MTRFAHPEFLYVLLALPLLFVIFLVAERARRKAMERFGNLDLVLRLAPMASRKKSAGKFLLRLIGFGLLALGMANPQIGTELEEVRREGVDIFIALDVSNSMKATDIKPSRLESAKRQIALLLGKLQNDRIGLIVFAGQSYVQLPLTTDYGAARLFLNTVDTDVVPVPGTAMGSAIRLAMKSFVEEEKKHKVIILITDGENHEDDAMEAAKQAAAEGVVVHTIGMGSPLGAPIPVYEGIQRAGYKKDAEGNVVLTKLDEALLQQVAGAGNGKYLRASGPQDELDVLLKEIQSMEKKEFGTKIFTEFEDRFQYFLLPAFLLLFLDVFISERKNRLLGKFVKSFSLTPLKREE